MATIDKHISALLYDHECVIVPELGGFLTSYAPATIHPTQHTVTPPARRIAFNVFLKHNDGLLANAIVQAEKMTYPDALREIESYVGNCSRELAAGKKVIVERVGMLMRDPESNLQFEPFKNVNYLKDSFGLSPIQFMPVLHSDFEQEVEKQLRDFISLRPSQQHPRKPLRGKRMRLNLLNTTLLAGSLLWLGLNIYLVTPDHVSIASLNPFSVSVNEKETSPVPAKHDVYTQPSIERTESAAASLPAPTPQEKLNEAVTGRTSEAKYFIIAGAFSSIANASKKEAELKSQGFANARIIDNNEGLKLVCYEGFSTREEAFAELNRMKALNKEGWVYPR